MDNNTIFNNKQYWESRLNDKYDLQGVGDISLSVNYNVWSYRVTKKVLFRLLKKYTKSIDNNKVLDIGSGTGFVIEILQKLKKNVTGIDISPSAVKKLSAKFPDSHFIDFDIGSGILDVPENSFGCITAVSVLYHIVDDHSLNIALSNVHRALEKDGIFIFSDNFIHKKPYNISHQKCRTLAEYEILLKANNLEILNRVPNYVLMNDPLDATGKFYPGLWGRITHYSKKSKLFDSIIWRFLYPIESVLVFLFKESPAQEFMICRAVK